MNFNWIDNPIMRGMGRLADFIIFTVGGMFHTDHYDRRIYHGALYGDAEAGEK